jgi:hypothetical protein
MTATKPKPSIPCAAAGKIDPLTGVNGFWLKPLPAAFFKRVLIGGANQNDPKYTKPMEFNR